MNGTLIFMYSRLTQTAGFLWVQDPIAENFIIPDGILVPAAGVAGVALDGVDDAVFTFFHDADVIGFAVLRAGCAVRVIPVEENDHAGSGLNRIIRPLLAAAEPFNAADAPRQISGRFPYQDNRTR